MFLKFLFLNYILVNYRMLLILSKNKQFISLGDTYIRYYLIFGILSYNLICGYQFHKKKLIIHL